MISQPYSHFANFLSLWATRHTPSYLCFPNSELGLLVKWQLNLYNLLYTLEGFKQTWSDKLEDYWPSSKPLRYLPHTMLTISFKPLNLGIGSRDMSGTGLEPSTFQTPCKSSKLLSLHCLASINQSFDIPTAAEGNLFTTISHPRHQPLHIEMIHVVGDTHVTTWIWTHNLRHSL